SDGRGYAFDFVSPTEGQLGRLREFVQRRAAGAARAVEPHFRVLRAISRALSLSLDVDQMLRIALDALTRVTGHEVSSLHLLSDDRRTLRLLADRGLGPELREANRVLKVGQGVIGRVAVTGETVHLTNAASCTDLPPAERAVVEREGIRGLVGGLLQTRGGKLAAGLVHEINNPLTVILGQAELVMTELADSTRGRERVRIILQETSRAARLLQKVLQLAQPQPSERRPCALLNQVQWVLGAKRHEPDREGSRVVTEFAPI